MINTSFDVVGLGENSVDYVYRVPGAQTPNSKLRASEHRVSYGGQVATTVAACASFGLRTAYVGAFGNDDGGRRIREELERRGIDTSRSLVRAAPNRRAVILVDERNGDRTVVWYRDEALALSAADILPETITRARLLHVDDLDEDASIAAAKMAMAVGMPVTSDVDRTTDRTEELVAATTVPIFSAHVPERLTGEADPERAMRKLRAAHHRWLCVTLGTHGAMMLDGDRAHHAPALKVTASDTTGAGDVFRGAFICAMLRGDRPADILRFAVAAAAVACTREGAIDAVPTLADVQRAMRG